MMKLSGRKFHRKNRGNPDVSANLVKALRKNRKQFNRLVVKHDMLYCLIYVDCRKGKFKQYCAPEAPWREFVFRLQTPKTARHFGRATTVEEFRKPFYLPHFTDFEISTVKDCLKCSQFKRVMSKNLKTLRESVSSVTSYPHETLQIYQVGPLKSPLTIMCWHLLKFIRITCSLSFENCQSRNNCAWTYAIFFRHSYLPKTILSGNFFCFSTFAWNIEIACNST